MEWESQAWEPTGLGAREQLVDRDSGPEGNEEEEASKAGAYGSKYLRLPEESLAGFRNFGLCCWKPPSKGALPSVEAVDTCV